MTNVSPPSIDSEHAEPISSLSDRVAARVRGARLAIESLPNDRRASPQDSKSIAEQREIQSLKRVYRDMGSAYRRYRSRMGGPVIPGLRDAAHSFKANPSLSALVGVAAFLDDLDLLS